MNAALFGDKLRDARERRGLSQQELADAVKINRVNITKYETNAQVPNVYTGKNLADVLGVSLDELTTITA